MYRADFRSYLHLRLVAFPIHTSLRLHILPGTNSSSLFKVERSCMCNSFCFHDKMKLPWRLHQFPPPPTFFPSPPCAPPTCKTYMFSYYFPFFSLLSTMMYKLWWSSKLGLTFISVLISISRLVRRPTQREMMAWHSQVPWRLDSRRLRWLGAS